MRWRINMPEDTRIVLRDFALPGAASEWQAVNDGVMGGVSEGTFQITDRKTLEFFGTLSLENNGVFASVRTRPKNLGLRPGDALRVRVRGDGRQYSLNLYVPRPQVAFSYRATVTTTSEAWVEVTLPLDTFEATSFGRVVKDAGAVKPEEINALGFMVSDKIAEPFKLEVGWVKVVREAK
jgi:NADH dehydrogenase [ubiquinone] 1 alpha subcomplex assembly factor 1